MILCDEWTEAQVKAFRLLVNRSVAWAEWDDELLAIEFQELQGLEFNLGLTGFALGEIETCLAKQQWRSACLTDEDAFPPPPPLPVTRTDDVWILGRHRVSCGDATQMDAVDRLMQGEKADLTFMDPPYNVNFDGRGSAGASWGRKKPARIILNDHLSDEEFLNFCRALFGSLRRAVKQSAAVYVCCSDKAMPQFRQAFSDAGFYWSCTVIWSTQRPFPL